MKHSLFFFNVLFFASLIIVFGSTGTYGLFYYDLIGRETRNGFVKVVYFVVQAFNCQDRHIIYLVLIIFSCFFFVPLL